MLDEDTAFVEALASLENPSLQPKADEPSNTVDLYALSEETTGLINTRWEGTDMEPPAAQPQEGNNFADMLYALEDSEFSRVCFGTVSLPQ